MPSLTDLISAASGQIKNQTGSVQQTLSSQVASATHLSIGTAQSIIPDTLGVATTGLNRALASAIQQIGGAGSSILQGDFNGALTKIDNSPQSILGQFTSAFQGNTGALSGPLSGPSSPINLVSSLLGISPSPSLSMVSAGSGSPLAGALARPDPMLSFYWFVELPVITPDTGSAVSLPWYYVEECTPPFRNYGRRPIFRNGKHKHYVSDYNTDDLSMVIYSDINSAALSYLYAWNNQILTPFTPQTEATTSGGFGTPSKYKFTINVTLVNPARATVAVLQYTGCWPTTITPYALNSGGSERLLHHVSFSVDDVYLNLYSTSGSTSTALSSLAPTGLSDANKALLSSFNGGGGGV